MGVDERNLQVIDIEPLDVMLENSPITIVILNLLVCVCVCVCFLPIHSGLQWTYQPGSHRKKVTQEFPSTFFLRCLP